jgi:hypothetical protein
VGLLRPSPTFRPALLSSRYSGILRQSQSLRVVIASSTSNNSLSGNDENPTVNPINTDTYNAIRFTYIQPDEYSTLAIDRKGAVYIYQGNKLLSEDRKEFKLDSISKLKNNGTNLVR